MKIFQILSGMCHWDASALCPNAAAATARFPGLSFVDAPDTVFEGWGYDASQTGDARFIKPTAPDGWHYDDATGVFYPDAEPEPAPTLAERVPIMEEQIKVINHRISDLEHLEHLAGGEPR